MNQTMDKIIGTLREKVELKVLFVCLGNICRSPAAEEILRHVVKENGDSWRWQIDSAGIGNWHAGQLPDHRMRVHARQRGLNLTHRARQVHTDDFFDFDMIVAMDAGNIADLRRIAPSSEACGKIVSMADFRTSPRFPDHVPDPYYEGSEGFELVLDMLRECCTNLYKALS